MLKNLIVNKFKENLLIRYDPDGTIFYFSPEELGLSASPFEFKGERAQALRGWFYKKGEVTRERLICFDHGMGCGHRAYLREIALLCEAGYEVFTYDHTGTRFSEGESIGGFTQSLVDLDYAISAIKAAGLAAGRKISVIGHSWGGFSTMNVPAFHRDIDSIVAFSGFISTRYMIELLLGAAAKYAPAVFALEEERFGSYAYADARLSLKLAQGTRALIFHSADDKICPDKHLDALEAALGKSERVRFVKVDGKGHNPNYTVDAALYKDEFFAAHTRFTKKKRLTDEEKAAFVGGWDWMRMTEQDREVWQTVIDFIEG